MVKLKGPAAAVRCGASRDPRTCTGLVYGSVCSAEKSHEFEALRLGKYDRRCNRKDDAAKYFIGTEGCVGIRAESPKSQRNLQR